MVPVEIWLNFGNYFRTLLLGFWKFLSHYALQDFSFYRPIRFDQNPEPLISLINRQEPLILPCKDVFICLFLCFSLEGIISLLCFPHLFVHNTMIYFHNKHNKSFFKWIKYKIGLYIERKDRGMNLSKIEKL